MVQGGIAAAGAGRLLERAFQSGHTAPQKSLRVIAAGKAAGSMAGAAARFFGSRIETGIMVGAAPGGVPDRFEEVVGGHPLPTADSERAGRRALALARSLSAGETLLLLLSGGASSLMAVPAEGITLDDKRTATERLLSAGADIHALNTVRKHLSAIKGGWLAVRAGGRTRTFAVSDVVGDDLSVIASGPTVADSSTFADAIDVLRRFGGVDRYPTSIRARFEAGAYGHVPETPKPDDPLLAGAISTVIGGRRDAMNGAAREAESRGYHVVRIDDPVVGEARTAARSHLRAAVARAETVPRPACIVSSGETTVRVTGRGKGGRNQEFALALAEPLALLGVPAAAVSAGTDGIDGPTDAAGAVVDSTTIERARTAAIGAPSRFLDDNNAYTFFDALGDLLRTGRTDTNVGDLQVVLLT